MKNLKFYFLAICLFCVWGLPVSAQIVKDTVWQGNISVNKTVIIENGASLKIVAGSKLFFTKDVEIIARDSSSISIEGTADNKVIICSASSFTLGGIIQVEGANSKLFMNYAEVMESRVKILDNASGEIRNTFMHDYIGENVDLDDISILYANQADTITIQSCYFSKMYQVNLYMTPALVDNCIFEYWFDDAIDFDNPPAQTLLKNCTFRHGVGFDKDAIDFGRVKFEGQFPKGRVENCLIYDVTDKGVSVGEGSELVIVNNCLIFNTGKGVGVKDSSKAEIYNTTVAKSENGFAIYEKNEGLGGGIAKAVNCILSENKTNVFMSGYSSLDISYSLTQDSLISGIGNISANPKFVNANSCNFALAEKSPAIGAGLENTNMGCKLPVGADFDLDSNSINIGFPNYRSVYYGNTTETIYWTAGKNIQSVSISYSIDGGNSWQSIATVSAASGSCQFLVPSVYSNRCKIKIVNEQDSTTFQQTLGFFTIMPTGEETSIPYISHSGGFYTEAFDLEMDAPAGSTIFYTTDGSLPTMQSNIYSAPIRIEKKTFSVQKEQNVIAGVAPFYPLSSIRTTAQPPIEWSNTWSVPTNIQNAATVVRAMVYTPGKMLSRVVTHTYWVNEKGRQMYSVPVISINTDAANLFDYRKGIYHIGAKNTPARKWETTLFGNCTQTGALWERPINIEYYDTTNLLIFSQNAGLRIRGQWHRMKGQKALTIYARSEYDAVLKSFDYPLFPGYKKPNSSSFMNRYKRFQLRNGGTEGEETHLHDALSNILFKDENIKISNYRPVVVFVNGEYWGMHELREVNDKFSLHNTYSFDEDSVTLIEDNLDGHFQLSEGKEEYLDEYKKLNAYILNSDINNTETLDSIYQQIDVDNFIDHWIARVFFGNYNYGHNLVYWKLSVPYNCHYPEGFDGKWRWMLNDFDWAFINPNNTFLDFLFEDRNCIFVKLTENQSFRFQFLNKFADRMNTNLNSNYTLFKLDSLANELEPLLPEQIARWHNPGNLAYWKTQVDSIRDFCNRRVNIQQQQLVQKFSLPGTAEFILNTDAEKGSITINSLDINSHTKGLADTVPYPWHGVYFKSVPVKIHANAKPGYKFVEWAETKETNPVLIVNPSSDIHNYTAIFESDSNNFATTIHYWSLNNPTTDNIISADISLTTQPACTEVTSSNNVSFEFSDNGTNLNISETFDNGDALRIKNPSDSMQIIINASTEGFSQITMTYATMRSSNGATIQEIFYSTGNDSSWTFIESVPVANTFEKKKVDFTSIPASNNNPNFKVKLLFSGNNTSLNEGSTYLDNIAFQGTISTTISSAKTPKNISVYPNPAKDKIYFQSNDMNSYSSVSILSIDGKVQKTFNSMGNSMYKEIPVGDLLSGVYLVKIQSNDRIFYSKFIKQ